MVTTIPGSDLLTSALNVISQSLQIPVIIFLLAFAVFAVYIIGDAGVVFYLLNVSNVNRE